MHGILKALLGVVLTLLLDIVLTVRVLAIRYSVNFLACFRIATSLDVFQCLELLKMKEN